TISLKSSNVTNKAAESNIAVQLLSPVMMTCLLAQSAIPRQPVKMAPGAGIAVRVTTVPRSNTSLQSGSQVIPAGVLVTVPLPLPALVIVKVCVSGGDGGGLDASGGTEEGLALVRSRRRSLHTPNPAIPGGAPTREATQ